MTMIRNEKPEAIASGFCLLFSPILTPDLTKKSIEISGAVCYNIKNEKE